jgi:hypothetical protein
MSKQKLESYCIEGRMGLCVGLTVQAKSLDEAIEKSKTLKLTDFIEFLGDHNDSNFAITGVFKGNGAPEV